MSGGRNPTLPFYSTTSPPPLPSSSTSKPMIPSLQSSIAFQLTKALGKRSKQVNKQQPNECQNETQRSDDDGRAAIAIKWTCQLCDITIDAIEMDEHIESHRMIDYHRSFQFADDNSKQLKVGSIYSQHETNNYEQTHDYDHNQIGIYNPEGIEVGIECDIRDEDNPDFINRVPRVKLGSSVICRFCSTSFSNRKKQTEHIKSEHSERLKFYCKWPDCTFRSLESRVMKQHIERKHLAKSKAKKQPAADFIGTRCDQDASFTFPCHLCGRVMDSAVELQRHLISHTKIGYRCTWSECGYFFPSTSVAQIHLTNDHFKNDPEFAKRHAMEILEKVEPDLQSKSLGKPILEYETTHSSEVERSIIQKTNIQETDYELPAERERTLEMTRYMNENMKVLISSPIVSNSDSSACAAFESNIKNAFKNDQSTKLSLPLNCPSELSSVESILSNLKNQFSGPLSLLSSPQVSSSSSSSDDESTVTDSTFIGLKNQTTKLNTKDIPKRKTLKRRKEYKRHVFKHQIQFLSQEPESQIQNSSNLTCVKSLPEDDEEEMEIDKFALEYPSDESNTQKIATISSFKKEFFEPLSLHANLSETITYTTNDANELMNNSLVQQKEEMNSLSQDLVNKMNIIENNDSEDYDLHNKNNINLKTESNQSNSIYLRNMKCRFCGRMFSHSRPLNNHYRFVHPEVLPFYCKLPFCLYGTIQTFFMKKHLREKHSIVDNVADFIGTRAVRDTPLQCVCHLCGRTIEGASLLRKHIASHVKAGYRCNFKECGFFFPSTTKNARKHIKLDHFKDDPEYAEQNPINYLQILRPGAALIQKKTNRFDEDGLSVQTSDYDTSINESTYLEAMRTDTELTTDDELNNAFSSEFLSSNIDKSTVSSSLMNLQTSHMQQTPIGQVNLNNPLTNIAPTDALNNNSYSITQPTFLYIHPQGTSSKHPLQLFNSFSAIDPMNHVIIKNFKDNVDIFVPIDSTESTVSAPQLYEAYLKSCVQRTTSTIPKVNEIEPVEQTDQTELLEQIDCLKSPDNLVMDPQIETCFDDNTNSNQSISDDDQMTEFENVHITVVSPSEAMFVDDSNVVYEEDEVPEGQKVQEVSETQKVPEVPEAQKAYEVSEEREMQTAQYLQVVPEVPEVQKFPEMSEIRQMELMEYYNEIVTSSQPRDCYCFECHKKVADSDKNIKCSLCPLIYHLWCVESASLFKKQQLAIKRYNALEQKPQEEDDEDKIEISNLQYKSQICDECVLKIVGKRFNRSKDGFSSASGAFNDDVETTFYNISNFLINKIKQWKLWGYQRLIKAADESNKKIFQKMDLETIESNAAKYQSIDKFIFDIKVIAHNRSIMSNGNRYVAKNCSMLLAQARQEAKNIYMCDSCYRMYYREPNKNLPKGFYKGKTQYGGVFLLACQNPHSVVWVQVDRIWWPAKVFPNYTECSFEISTDMIKVVTFGPQTMVIVEPSVLYEYSNELPENGHIETEVQQIAIDEAEYYLARLDTSMFDNTVPKSPRPYQKGNLYINTKPSANRLPVADQIDPTGKNINWKCNVCRKDFVNRKLDSCTISYCSLKCKRTFLHRPKKNGK